VQNAKFKGEIAQHFPLPSTAGGQAMPPVGELLKRTGDAAKGRLVYEKVESTCVTCHRIGDTGSDVGPALTEIGSKLAKEVLYEAILAPNAGISMGFETTQLGFKSGDVAMGIVRSETEDELVLAMPGGIQNRYKKADISKREKLPISLMPTGLQAVMTTDQLVDMVEYLASLKKQ
jgi:putative heme-binding domain-containing protein